MKAVLPAWDADGNESIPTRFGRVVDAAPDAVAISTDGAQVTYRDLRARAVALAVAILDQQNDEPLPVAVLAQDIVSMVTGQLAVWMAGRLCVPLDPHAPRAAIASILRDAGAGLLLLDREAAVHLGGERPCRPLMIDEFQGAGGAAVARTNVAADDPACLLYTSGSTGAPKGLVRSHRSAVHRARCAIASLGIVPGDRVSCVHSPAFAAGLRDVLAALLGGATLMPFDARRAGDRAMADWIRGRRVSVFCSVVTTLRRLVAAIGPDETFPSVRAVRTGSEPLYRADVERFWTHFREDCVLVYGYGASEAAGIVEYRITRDTPLPTERVPVGFPLDGVRVLVLGNDGQPVGPGQPGEVAVESHWITEGYWRTPDLIRDRFVQAVAPGGPRTYRTGDIGRILPDGCLELLGRRDYQVKVRGYRVRTDAIEATLSEHPSVSQAAVTAHTDSLHGTRLAAYVVARPGVQPTPDELGAFLRSRLPLYMCPAHIGVLDAFPVGPTGKVNRNALPEPPAERFNSAVAFEPTQTALERQIADLWEDILGVSPIGRTANFFDLGGDSLGAVRLMAAIEERCARVLSPSVLMAAPTVAELAAAILRGDGTVDEPLTTVRATGTAAPLFFVHNEDGRGVFTHGLARALPADRPVYAVHLHGLASHREGVSVPEIASMRLDAIRAACPQGPCILGGYCQAGTVALELACQLEDEGREVALVVLVDTRAPRRGMLLMRRVSERIASLRRLTPAGAEQQLLRIDAAVHDVQSRRVGWRWRLRRRDNEGLLAWLGRGSRSLVVREAAAVHAGEPAQSARSTAADAWRRTFRRAARLYAPRTYRGRVLLIRSEGFPTAHADLGWSGFLASLTVVVVPGDHQSVVTRHVASLAEEIEKAARSAEPSVVSGEAGSPPASLSLADQRDQRARHQPKPQQRQRQGEEHEGRRR